MRLAVLSLLLLSTTSVSADKWMYFYPEAVTSIGCKVISSTVSDGRTTKEMYIADAWADRSHGLGRWEMQIAEEPFSDKGWKQAIKECYAWSREAHRRIRKGR